MRDREIYVSNRREKERERDRERDRETETDRQKVRESERETECFKSHRETKRNGNCVLTLLSEAGQNQCLFSSLPFLGPGSGGCGRVIALMVAKQE